jgi:putative ABC transport system permease protein
LARSVEPDAIAAVVERLIVPVQVDASHPGETLLVPGELVGAPPDATVDRLDIVAGKPPSTDGVVVERSFADRHGLPTSGTLTLAGGTTVAYRGHGSAPEYFVVSGRGGSFLAQANTVVLFAPLTSVQALGGLPGAVNDLVVRLAPGTDREAVRDRLTAALDGAGVSGTATTREEEPAYRVLYEDIESDRQFWNVFAVLILAGAAFAAFNLTSRIVEAQRREIGVGMALGVPSARLALRPLLLGVEVAVLGTVAGLGFGLGLSSALRAIFVDMLPLPVWRTPFQAGPFLRAAALGMVLPTVATAIPVWRAVRVEPVEAIHAAPRGRGSRRAARLELPGRSYLHLPLRNLRRAPRRTLLTAFGVAAAVTTMVGILGMLDTFFFTIERGEADLARRAPERLVVDLDRFQPVEGAVVQALVGAPGVTTASPGLRVPMTARRGAEELDLAVELVEFDGPLWRPELPAGAGRGLVVTEKARRDLGLSVGSSVAVSHLVRRDDGSFATVERSLPVVATHPGPLRPVAYLDLGEADTFGLAGLANTVQLGPAEGTTPESLKRTVFTVPGVAAVEGVGDTSRLFRDALDEFTSVFRLVQGVALALAVLIAFNSAGIAVDERARDHATMFAFGLPLRTVAALTAVESMLVGLLATGAGLLGGWAVLSWVSRDLLPRTLPDLSLVEHIALSTVWSAVVIGVVGVGVAALFTVPRLRRIDLSGTLRVVE